MALLLLPVLALDASATIYQYTDDSGTVVMTNKKSEVPAKSRSGMKVIKEDTEKKAQKAPVPQHDPVEEAASQPQPQPQSQAAAPAAVPEGRFAQLCTEYPWLRPVAYLAAFFAAFLLVVKLTALLPSPQMAKAIYLLFFLGVGVFIYKSYVDHVAQSFTEVKSDAKKIVEKTNQRPDPMREMMKDAPDVPEKASENR